MDLHGAVIAAHAIRVCTFALIGEKNSQSSVRPSPINCRARREAFPANCEISDAMSSGISNEVIRSTYRYVPVVAISKST